MKTAEQRAAYMREWRRKNPEKSSAASRKWYRQNRDKVREKQLRDAARISAYRRDWETKNAEKLETSRKAWKQNNVEKLTAYARKWKQKNPEWVTLYRQRNSLKLQARQAIAVKVRYLGWPAASELLCSICGQKADHYHHHFGYERAYWYDVIPVCKKCHKEIHHHCALPSFDPRPVTCTPKKKD